MKSLVDYKLQDLCKRVVSGGTPLRSVAEYYENGTIPWLKTGEVKKGQIYETEEKITEKGLQGSSAKLIPVNSIIVAMYGDGNTAGNVAINKILLATNQACCNFVFDSEKAHYKFVYYYLKGSYNNLINLKLGGSQQNLNAQTLKTFPISTPALKNQKKIAAALSSYDDLIENNKLRIALLEKMAEEIYREWFVRMRFPGHEKVKVVKGMPEGWDVKKLGEILELCYGKALKEEDRISGNFPVYGSSGIVGTHNKALVNSAGIIVGRKGNVGSVHWSDCGFFAIDTAYYVKSTLSNFYLYYLLQSMNFINNDAAVPGLNRNQAYSNLLYLPPDSLIREYSDKAKQLFEFKDNLKKQNEILTQTRDSLLPRLISCKLSVENLNIQFPPSMQDEATS